MKRITIALISTFLIIFSNCSSDNKTKNQSLNTTSIEANNPYLKKYASGYTIEVKGITSKSEVEAYALTENGEAKWLWIENDGHGEAVLKQKKTGTWTASENKITIKIQGNSGLITEEYVMLNGIFVSTVSDDRYLKISK
jgi:hypothetical protein